MKDINITKGYSLTELLVAMAIIAILVSLAVFGIGILQRNSRNAQRTQLIGQINLGIRGYKTENGVFPTLADLNNSLAPNGNNLKFCHSGDTSDCSSNFTELDSAPEFLISNSTGISPNTTRYCYFRGAQFPASNFQIGFEIEGNTDVWEVLDGTDGRIAESECQNNIVDLSIGTP